jgi:hypothetical protein
MRNVMNHQNFTHYPNVLGLIRDSEFLFRNIQKMESVMPLQAEERLFIEAIRDLNFQASRMQQAEKNHNEIQLVMQTSPSTSSPRSPPVVIGVKNPVEVLCVFNSFW